MVDQPKDCRTGGIVELDVWAHSRIALSFLVTFPLDCEAPILYYIETGSVRPGRISESADFSEPDDIAYGLLYTCEVVDRPFGRSASFVTKTDLETHKPSKLCSNASYEPSYTTTIRTYSATAILAIGRWAGSWLSRSLHITRRLLVVTSRSIACMHDNLSMECGGIFTAWGFSSNLCGTRRPASLNSNLVMCRQGSIETACTFNPMQASCYVCEI